MPQEKRITAASKRPIGVDGHEIGDETIGELARAAWWRAVWWAALFAARVRAPAGVAHLLTRLAMRYERARARHVRAWDTAHGPR